MKLYDKLFRFIASKRIQKGDLDLRKVHSLTAVVLSTSVLMWAYAFLAYYTISSPIPGIVGFICSTIHLLSPLLFLFSADAFMIANLLLAAGIIHQATFSFYTGGFTSFVLIWFGILPMIAGILAGRVATILWAVLTSVIAGSYLAFHLNGFQFPDLISSEGRLIAQFLIVFGWIFLSTSIIYVLLVLNEQKERMLAEQNTKIDDLFKVLFHDLAGPLSRISIGISLAKENDSQEKRDYGIEVVSRANESLADITQNVRKMYALSKGKLESNLVYYPLNEAMEYIQRVYAFEMLKKNIRLEYDAKKFEGLHFLVEPISFKNQVLGNAVSNAIKFSKPDSKIRVDAYPHDSHSHVIEIADEGIGMSKELQDSLFDIHKKTTRKGTSGESGNGFGMHIMKSFVEMFQGKLIIESYDEKYPVQGTNLKIILKTVLNQE